MSIQTTRLRAAFGALLLALLFLPQVAGASCAQVPLLDLAKGAEIIVHGRVVKTEQPPSGGTFYTFELDRIYKGNPLNPIIVFGQFSSTTRTSVDYEMADGSDHTLYLLGMTKGYYETNACTGSHSGKPAGEEATLFGEGRPAPAPGIPPRTPGAPPVPLIRVLIPWMAMGLAFTAILGVLFVPRYLKGRR